MTVVRLLITFFAACIITCSVAIASSLICDPTNGTASESQVTLPNHNIAFIYDVSGPTYRIRQIYFASDMHAGADPIISSAVPAYRRTVTNALPPWRGEIHADIDDILATWRSWPTRTGAMSFDRKLVAHGWPLLAFDARYTGWITRAAGNAGSSTDVESGILWSSSPLKILPWSPLWPGLLLNIVFYTATLLLAETLYRIARRHQRTRRGLCPACAYDRSFVYSTPCPECGATTAAMQAPSQAH